MNTPAFLQRKSAGSNINETERMWSLIGGSGLIAYGLLKRNTLGYSLAAIGGGLVLRGVRGECEMYKALGIDTSEHSGEKGTGSKAGVGYQKGIRVDRDIAIQRTAEDLYQFWRNLENLPRFMHHLESVNTIGEGRSHWVAHGPAGLKAEWDAEIVNDIPNEVIGWRSLEGSRVANGGSVRFESLADGSGTIVRVSLQYLPPAGQLGAIVARLFGEDPNKTIAEDLSRFKELMETGAVSAASSQRRSMLPIEFNRQKKADAKAWDRDQVSVESEQSFPASDPPSWTPESAT